MSTFLRACCLPLVAVLLLGLGALLLRDHSRRIRQPPPEVMPLVEPAPLPTLPPPLPEPPSTVLPQPLFLPTVLPASASLVLLRPPLNYGHFADGGLQQLSEEYCRNEARADLRYRHKRIEATVTAMDWPKPVRYSTRNAYSLSFDCGTPLRVEVLFRLTESEKLAHLPAVPAMKRAAMILRADCLGWTSSRIRLEDAEIMAFGLVDVPLAALGFPYVP